jgi:hypothetical protein
MRAIQLTAICVAAIGASASQIQGELIVVDSINATASPHPVSSWATGVGKVGWFYTPTFSYELAGIATKFRSADSRTVTAEIYDEFPGDGGVLLRTASFSPLSGVFSGGIFSAPLGLSSGVTYFFGFTNVEGLGVNVTNDAGATNLSGGMRFSTLSGNYNSGPETGYTAQPIIQFQAMAVPEPNSLALCGIGACVMAIAAARRRRRARFPAAG